LLGQRVVCIGATRKKKFMDNQGFFFK
jgi:hypothetical protein